jgi:phospholipase/carboxylesterase
LSADLRFIQSGSLNSNPIVVFLHGYGSDETDLPSLLSARIGGLDWISVRAPIILSEGGFGWTDFPDRIDPDLYRLFPSTLAASPPPETSALDPAYLAEVERLSGQARFALDRLTQLLDQVIPAEQKILPIGFSQGAMMTGQLARNYPERLVGAAVLSGYLDPHPQPADQRISDFRLFVGWGDQDALIPASYAHYLIDFFRAHAQPEVHIYPGQVHTVSEIEISHLEQYLTEIAPPTPAHR